MENNNQQNQNIFSRLTNWYKSRGKHTKALMLITAIVITIGLFDKMPLSLPILQTKLILVSSVAKVIVGMDG